VLTEGESVFVPLSTAHRFWNSSIEPVVFEVEIRPARSFEKSLRAQFGLVQDGKTTDKAIPKNILELALIYELSESYTLGELHSRHAPVLAEGDFRSAGEDRSVEGLRPRVLQVHQA
jgi:hypothetical protein